MTPQSDLMRHEALVPPHLVGTTMHIIGCGGVGSGVAHLLARLGVAQGGLHLHDGDTVAAHNIPNQLYDMTDVGQNKATTLANAVEWWSTGRTRAVAHPQMVTEPLLLEGTVFLCLDRMDARRTILRQSVWGRSKVPLVIETRMDVRHLVIYALDPSAPKHQERWEAEWFPDDEAENTAGCGGHFAIPTAVSACAAFAVQLLLQHSDVSGRDSAPNLLTVDLASYTLRSERWPTST